MKKNCIFLYLLLIICSFSVKVNAQTAVGKVEEHLSVVGASGAVSGYFSIYLPPNYTTGNRRFPVVYLLHGYSGGENNWIQFGNMERTMNEGIAKGELCEMIVVMPDAGNSWYVNDAAGKNKYEDFFTKDLIPYIDKTYATRAKKEFRGIAGLSMGGYGALLLSLKHNDLFVACSGLSSAVFTDEEILTSNQWDYYFADIFGKNLQDSARLTAHFVANNPMAQMKTLDSEAIKKVSFYLDCGDDDMLYRGNDALHTLMRNRQIPHEYRVRDGGHTWTYWRTGLPAALQFISTKFQH